VHEAEAERWSSQCLFIGPTGAHDSGMRRRFNSVFAHIVTPAIKDAGLEPIRIDSIPIESITSHVTEVLLSAGGVIADLTSASPNVYYEIAVRRSVDRPLVLIAEVGETLPFDIAEVQVIFLDHQDLASAVDARRMISQSLMEQIAAGAGRTEPAALGQDASARGRAEAVSWILRSPGERDAAQSDPNGPSAARSQFVASAAEWLRVKWKNVECPYCGAKDWRLGEDIVRIPIFGSANAYPAFPVVCGNCGQTAFVNAVQAGLIEIQTP
jgi:ribosomal protein S27AE